MPTIDKNLGIGAMVPVDGWKDTIVNTKKTDMLDALEQIYKQGLIHGAGGVKLPPPPPSTFGVVTPVTGKLSNTEAMGMLGMRLRVRHGASLPFDHVSLHVGEDKVYVFLVAKGGPLIIEDDEAMFPSDNLIAQLRLLQG